MPNAGASTGGAPGQYQPLSMPQNTIDANAMTDAMNNNGNGMGSPGSAGGPRRAAPEPNKRALYVGGLDPRVTEEVLKQIFETTGHVQSVKIIPDKNVSPVRQSITRCRPYPYACTCMHRAASRAAVLFAPPSQRVPLHPTRASKQLTSASFSQKVSTTASLNTTTLLLPNEQCRPSTEDVSTSR